MLRQRMRLAEVPVLTSMAMVILIIGNLLAWSLWDTTLIMDDGVQYMSTAANWLQGNGFATNALIYEPHFQNVLPAPQTVWPPALPLLQALVASTGIELQSSALLVNLLANTLSTFVVYLILRRCCTGITFAITCAMIYYLTASSWLFATALISEPLFTVLLLTAVYCLPPADNDQSVRWVLAGLLIAASIYTRYSAVFAAAAIVMALFFLSVIRSRRDGSASLLTSLKGLALFSVFPALAFVLLLLRTRQLSGTVERRTGIIESKSVADTFLLFAEELSVLTGFRDGLIFRNDVDAWMFVLCIFLTLMVVMTAVIILVSNRSPTAVKAKTFRPTVITIMLTHAFAFCGYLVYSSLSDTALNITSRYLYQIYPGLLIVMFLLVASVFEQAGSLVLSVYRWAIAVLVSLYLVAQINLITASRELSVRGIDSREIVGLQVADGITLSDVVQSCIGMPTSLEKSSQATLWSNDGVLLHLNTGVNTISLPSTYTTRNFDFKRWQEDIETYQIRLFIFINRAQSTNGLYGMMLEDIKQWLLDNQYPILQMQDSQLESGASVTIYLTSSQCIEQLRN